MKNKKRTLLEVAIMFNSGQNSQGKCLDPFKKIALGASSGLVFLGMGQKPGFTAFLADHGLLAGQEKARRSEIKAKFTLDLAVQR